MRLGLDRDGDGFLDRDELDAGSDPADAASTPGGGTPTPTEILPTATATATPTGPTPSATATPTDGPPPLGCPGDCSRDSVITIEELIRSVNIALGSDALDNCRNADRNGDGDVRINELLQAVRGALEGCELVPPGARRR